MKNLLIGLAMAAMATASHAATVYDGSALTGSGSVRAAGNSPVGNFTFAESMTLTGISQIVDLDADGDVKFVIFENGTLAYESAAISVTDIGVQTIASAAFSFTVDAGSQYQIGAVSNVGGVWRFGSGGVPNVQGAITQLANWNVTGFDSPTVANSGGAVIGISLSAEAIAAVPLPAGGALLLLALGATGAVRRRGSAA